MFGLLTNAIVNVLDIGDSILSGEAPSKRQIAKLIDDGLTIAAVATMFGVAEEVILGMLEE